MNVTYGSTLRNQSNEALMRAYASAVRSVEAWAQLVNERGSLLKSWIGDREAVMGERYPDPDITDRRHGCQFFYHSHRQGKLEHGHVHLFYHASASGSRRYVNGASNPWQRNAPSHLFGIGLDNRGLPVSLFTVNLWVTGGFWFDAATTFAMVKRFKVSSVAEHRESAAWITGFVAMYLPLIERLLHKRDHALRRLAGDGGMDSLLQDRRREVVNAMRIDWLGDVARLEAELTRRQQASTSRKLTQASD